MSNTTGGLPMDAVNSRISYFRMSCEALEMGAKVTSNALTRAWLPPTYSPMRAMIQAVAFRWQKAQDVNLPGNVA